MNSTTNRPAAISHALTLTNPEALHTVADLRRELHHANQHLMQATEQLTRLSCQAMQLSEWIELAAAHFEEGNPGHVHDMLRRVLEQKASFKARAH